VRYRVTSVPQRIFMTTVCAFFFAALIIPSFGRNGAQPGELAIMTIFLAVLAWLGVRSTRMATLLADEHKVVIRGLVRTRSWSWDQIDAFVVGTRTRRSVGGFATDSRRVLCISQRDGSLRWLTGLSSPAIGGHASWIDDAAATLNQHLAKLQSSGVVST
jgi:hypothetical protein